MKRKNVFLLSFIVAVIVLIFSAEKSVHAAGDNTCSNRAISGVDPCVMSNGTKRGICAKNTGDTKPMCYASPAPSNAGPTSFINPLRFDNVEDFLGGILSAIQKIIVVLALVFIMIGAVLILTSAGSSGMVEKGKGAITMALVGLALGVAAPSLLKELSGILGWGQGAEIDALTLTEIAVNVLNFLLGSMGILALVMLVIGAIMYLTSAGNEDMIDKGKEIFKYSLIGVVLAMSAMVLVTQIAQFFTTTPSSSTPPEFVGPPAPSVTPSGGCENKNIGDICRAGSDSISWDGVCNDSGSCVQI